MSGLIDLTKDCVSNLVYGNTRWLQHFSPERYWQKME